MRVLYLNYEWDRRGSSGAARHVDELTKGLAALGHQVVIYDRHLEPQTEVVARIGNATSTKPSFRKKLSRYLHETAALARTLPGMSTETDIIRRERPDVVLTRYSLHQFSSLFAARRCHVPIVFEVNAPVAYEYRNFKPQYALLPWLPEWSETATLARADGVFVVSNQLKQNLAGRGVPSDLIRVIPNGVDVEMFKPEAIDSSVRDTLGKDRVIVGFVGSFANFHGIDALRTTIEAVTSPRTDVSFMMVGHSALTEALAITCAQLGISDRVMFKGYVPPQEVPSLMGAADILIAPYEAQEFFYMSPIKIFEYMASGRAILAASVGQIAELIEDGKTGLLYDPEVPQQLAEKLLLLAGDPALRATLGEAAREKAVEQYTWKHNAERVADLLRDACHRAAQHGRQG